MSILTLTLNPALDLTVSLKPLNTGAVNLANHGHLGAAGKGINVARVLADLGHRPRATGFLGLNNDASFRAMFERYGIEDDFVRLAGDTRVNVKISEEGGRVTDINLPGLQVEKSDWNRLLARLESLERHFDTLVVAGSLPPGVYPKQLEGLIDMWRERGKLVLLDASGETLRVGIKGFPALIKPNIDELVDLVGRPIRDEADLADCARELQQQGIQHIVVSNGAEGVHWFSPRGAWKARVPKVKVVSTVGAGDSLVAGLCAGLLEGRDEAFTLRRAVALSIMAVTQVGVGISNKQQLNDYQDAIEITQLEPSKV
ncbi:1-phosphofructokinase [Oceanisphaera arctica]|uniref:Phosphofructokinase n=1 Tax=Oceanisphaera arctica TaxID=641510 RepID=A0A2P5TR01_9GAMM|nr:1-phosphofructokinase [Oceanisphaera arctica]PPL18233.1 1-phosphofructokinase [Oceanisphaera arctica]GHA12589.1 phosphofructokinase [Oceanisphaera arctica]